mmetsp:Transcript_9104/g.11997  ORF Transcript_9104/g.11997 Transcript_9104/m.11997 type:complete len:123 (-) Transcript_9104:402-770(-)
MHSVIQSPCQKEKILSHSGSSCMPLLGSMPSILILGSGLLGNCSQQLSHQSWVSERVWVPCYCIQHLSVLAKCGNQCSTKACQPKLLTQTYTGHDVLDFDVGGKLEGAEFGERLQLKLMCQP